jgi:hypothetical protein
MQAVQDQIQVQEEEVAQVAQVLLRIQVQVVLVHQVLVLIY